MPLPSASLFRAFFNKNYRALMLHQNAEKENSTHKSSLTLWLTIQVGGLSFCLFCGLLNKYVLQAGKEHDDRFFEENEARRADLAKRFQELPEEWGARIGVDPMGAPKLEPDKIDKTKF